MSLSDVSRERKGPNYENMQFLNFTMVDNFQFVNLLNHYPERKA